MEQSFVIQSADSQELRQRVGGINKLFDVKVRVQKDPNSESEGLHWVYVKGKHEKNIKDAKTHIIALCNPELKEHISFPGFPVFIFAAFQERIKNKVQVKFGIVLSLTDDGFMDIWGSNFGVTMAISKIHHLHKLNRDLDGTKAFNESLQFDDYVEETEEGYVEELQTLSNTLKKELLQMLEIPIKLVPDGVTTPKRLKDSPEFARKKPPPRIEESVIVLDSTREEEEDSIIVLDSSEEIEEEESDEEYVDDDEVGRIASDGADKTSTSFILPPNFVIKEWLKIHYEGTTNPADFVNKNDMLDHFKSHFDLPDHEDLANTFFDKLAVRIFPQDPNYRSVKTKRTKSKHAKRRLVCLRRRTVSGGDGNEASSSSSCSPPRQIPPPVSQPQTSQPGRIPPPVKQPQIIQVHSNTPPQSDIMKDWNANRMIAPKEPPKPFPENPSKSIPQQAAVMPLQQILPPPQQPNQLLQPVPQQAPVIPMQQILPMPQQPLIQHILPPPQQSQYEWKTVQHPSRSQPPKPLGDWLSSSPPRPKQRQTSGAITSLSKRVSLMNNKELLNRPRPTPDASLRHIIIDGSNVAMEHGHGQNFSCRGIALCARFFIERGHKDVTCLVPNYRKGGGGNPPSSDANILIELEKRGIVKCTPSRRIGGRNIVCYDDRFMVELAGAEGGVIVSNDQYRDLMAEDRNYRPIIEQQLLQYTLVGDMFMFPKDPLGSSGPTLEEFLTRPEARNRPKKPDRPQQKVVRVPAPIRPRHSTASQRPQPVNINRPLLPTPNQRPSPHAPVTGAWMRPRNAPVILNPDQQMLAYQMLDVLPNREEAIKKVISDHPLVTNVQELLNFLLISDSGT